MGWLSFSFDLCKSHIVSEIINIFFDSVRPVRLCVSACASKNRSCIRDSQSTILLFLDALATTIFI